MEVLVFFIEFYTAFFIFYVAFIVFRKKKVPWLLVIINLLVIALFWYLEYLVDESKISFLGRENGTFNDSNSEREEMSMGAGLAWLYDRFILSAIFLLTQIIFFIPFRIKYDRINSNKK